MSIAPAWIVVGRTDGAIDAAALTADGDELSRERIDEADWAAWVAEREHASPRWVWSDAVRWQPGLLASGVRVARCHDLRLCHAILRHSAWVADATALGAHAEWTTAPVEERKVEGAALFEWEEPTTAPAGPPDDLASTLEEFARQRDAVAGAADAGRLRLLLAAESAGALIAGELRAAGLPWDEGVHDTLLRGALGERPAGGGAPTRMAALATEVRALLGDPALSLDSQPKLLRGLHRAGVLVESTSRWELREHQHPAIAPLLEYKKLARLLTANGWNWLEEWVDQGRFRPVYIPGGVVTGRWASSGGGALQLPRQLRPAVRADPGWRLVVADVAQLEPRVLAAMAQDSALAAAARGRDLYAGIVDTGTVATRDEAKVALLGAMYGATTGDSGRLVPRLRRTFPRAMGLVDAAAETGERGGVVTTWLGRSSPAPSAGWLEAQAAASQPGAAPAEETRARRWARDRGRFTRNFVVQGTAAEWALAWLADLRTRLAQLPPVDVDAAAPRSGPVFQQRPHLAMFLHDEVIVHTPAALAAAVADAAREAAASATRLLFGDIPLDFPLDLRIAETAAKG
ncbi:bifunctional 3'-5' exonuclease/DNA polymerase [Microbacterium terricola]|uniref:DNA-directed DNA polymerase n=1 Tax=Microbacterium terricola TaxID=344163 RepID=A0ABM8DYQ2_9MICO|nr:bifunctional 3'-5' exonuclease/DNA polymerase [Microbacterium terricola]UYK38637.1 bifunctional 3'-5' exonuclease/DNA polymerase [Microbacterium terricola]BDV30676.1 bifunctional 3'-5' exonuclease/DNA polymerase [Microbacterium terricola]